MALTRVRGAGVGTLSGDTTTVTLEDTSSHSANTGPAISFKSKDSGGTTREVAKVIGESHSGTDEGNLALQTRNGGTLETKWKVFKNGNLLPSSTDYGIYLGATAAGDANLLNDYEEGTWTPGISGRTLGSAFGFYTKIGNVVNVLFDMNTMAGGNVTTPNLTGLPFTSSNSSSIQYAGFIMIHEPYGITANGDRTYAYWRIGKNGTTGLMLQGGGDTGTFSHQDGNVMVNGSNARGMGQYFTDA